MNKEERINHIFLEDANIFRKWINCLYTNDGDYNLKATLDEELKSRINTQATAIDCMNAIDHICLELDLMMDYVIAINKPRLKTDFDEFNFDEIASSSKIFNKHNQWLVKDFRMLSDKKLNAILNAPIGYNGFLLKDTTLDLLNEYAKCVKRFVEDQKQYYETHKNDNFEELPFEELPFEEEKINIPKIDHKKLSKKIPIPNYLTTLKNQSTKKSIQRFVDAQHQFAIKLIDNGNEIFEIDNAILCNVLYLIGQNQRQFTDADIYKVWNKGRNIKITKQTTQFIEESINKMAYIQTNISFTMDEKKYIAHNVDYLPLHITDEISNGKRVRYYQAKTDNYSDYLLKYIQSNKDLMQRLGNKSIDEIKQLPLAYVISIMKNQYNSSNPNYFCIPKVKQNKTSISIEHCLAKRIESMRHNQQKGIINIDSFLDECNIDWYTYGKKDKKKKYNALLIIGKILEHYKQTPILQKNDPNIIFDYAIYSKNGKIKINVIETNESINENIHKQFNSGIFNKLDLKTKTKINNMIKNKSALKKSTLIEYINIQYDDQSKTQEENINDIIKFIDGTFKSILNKDDGQTIQKTMQRTIETKMKQVSNFIDQINTNEKNKRN